ncbi:MAG: beta-carotene hydroxylase [Oxalobacteraceae bacterium]|jgi:beta-carotene 3-hydroxylase|nr:MAG: beta-carotene hydroxylase [Oxalobacteraceae bacterium]
MKVFNLFLVLATMFVMEGAVTLIHKYVMHGFGWGWHRSHHVARRQAGWEKNDLYAIVFAAATIGLFALGDMHAPLWWIALGVTLYGMVYGVMHDVLIHKRLPHRWRPKNRYLKRLMTAHYLHHATRTREGGISFGFLYAPPVDRLRQKLRSNKPGT